MVNVLETSWNWSGEAVHTSVSHSTWAIIDSVNAAASTSTHPWCDFSSGILAWDPDDLQPVWNGMSEENRKQP